MSMFPSNQDILMKIAAEVRLRSKRVLTEDNGDCVPADSQNTVAPPIKRQKSRILSEMRVRRGMVISKRHVLPLLNFNEPGFSGKSEQELPKSKLPTTPPRHLLKAKRNLFDSRIVTPKFVCPRGKCLGLLDLFKPLEPSDEVRKEKECDGDDEQSPQKGTRVEDGMKEVVTMLDKL